MVVRLPHDIFAKFISLKIPFLKGIYPFFIEDVFFENYNFDFEIKQLKFDQKSKYTQFIYLENDLKKNL